MIGPSETSPLVDGGRVYVGDWTGNVYALDAKTGGRVWTYRTGGEVKGGLALTGKRLFVGSYDHHLYALDARTGAADLARVRPGAPGQPRDVLLDAGRRPTGASTSARPTARSTRSVRRAASCAGRSPPAATSTPRRRSGGSAILIGSYSGKFFSLDAATGDVQWTFEANGPISGSASVIGNVVYFSTLKGRTYGLDATTGKQVWSFPDGKYSAGRRGARPPLPDRLHAPVRSRVPLEAPRIVPVRCRVTSPVGLPPDELGPPARLRRRTSTPSRRSISAATGARSPRAGGCRSAAWSSGS